MNRLTALEPTRPRTSGTPRTHAYVCYSLLIAVIAMALTLACGDGTTPLVNLTLTPSTRQTVHVNQSFAVNTSITNYTGNTPLNVTWALTCVGSCGTVIPNYTVVGQPIVYTAPSTVPSGNVTLTADLMYGHAGPRQQLTITVVP